MHTLWIRNALLFLAIFVAATGFGAASAQDVRELKDIDFIEGADYANNKDKLDLYLPEGVENFPVLVFLHGGGLRQGDKSGSAHVGRALAASGYGAAIVNYRLSPDVAHPAHAEDAAASIAWIYRHIKDYGGNPEKLFVSGWSAGAYLCALLALDERYLNEQGLTTAVLGGVMPISGFFYVDLVAPDRPKDVWGEDEKVWVEASPSQYGGADGPPILFLYADGDAPWRKKQNEDIAEALAAKGHSDVSTTEIANRNHPGIHKQIGPKDQTLEAMLVFMQSK